MTAAVSLYVVALGELVTKDTKIMVLIPQIRLNNKSRSTKGL